MLQNEFQIELAVKQNTMIDLSNCAEIVSFKRKFPSRKLVTSSREAFHIADW